MLNIGITCRLTEANDYFEERNSLSLDWISFFNRLDFMPTLIPNGIANLGSYMDNCNLDGVILSGGNNVNPKLYSSTDNLDSIYDIRDKNEFEILKYCVNNDLPLIGICRGMFILNIFFKGSLTHNIKEHVNQTHKVKISRFNNYFNDNKLVNSFHHHGIKEENISPDMDYFAISEDGIVEGICKVEDSIYGLQWHPERKPIDKQTERFMVDIFNKKIK